MSHSEEHGGVWFEVPDGNDPFTSLMFLWTCRFCGCLINGELREIHIAWHVDRPGV
jgi:hypothetical protein